MNTPSTLADMLVQGEPPDKFRKALGVIAANLHPRYDMEPWIAPGHSKRSCVLSSLAIRDFLRKIGFKDAEVRPVVLAMHAMNGDGEKVHSIRCGHPDMEIVRREFLPGGDWPGHMVVVVPSVGYMIDATLYQAQRAQWPSLPGMVANLTSCGLGTEDRVLGLPLLSGLEETHGDGAVFECVWLDQSANRLWRQTGDAHRPKYRANVVKRLVGAFERSMG